MDDSFLEHPGGFLPPLFIIYTCLKILLIPSYRSTDFDVHRNWLAVTRQTGISEWYWNDVNGTTVHTLDYPPAFAFFEYLLSHEKNPMTNFFLPEGDRCLELLPDTDNDPSEACVLFQRSTVILADVLFWAGAWFACRSYHVGRPARYAATSFLLIVLNPALLWLDHIHFQYNGMMIGVFLASLGCLFMGNNNRNSSSSGKKHKPPIMLHDFYHLMGAAIFALLLNLKHLYLPLAPLYLCYLLKTYCFTGTIPPGQRRNQFMVGQFGKVAVVTGMALVLPWFPFVYGTDDPKGQVVQILKRLFPFGRGLVHDYWAGNVWAIYSFSIRIGPIVASLLVRMLEPVVPALATALERAADFAAKIPEPSPAFCGLALLVAIVPGLSRWWNPAASQEQHTTITNKKLVESVVYVSLCAFMLAYHVHEKAILTAWIPLSLLVEPPFAPANPGKQQQHYNLLFWIMSLFGLLGLLPLLFRPIELTIKLASYVCYMGLVSYLLAPEMQGLQRGACGLVALTVGLLDFAPIQGKWEFLPLMVTSLVCALGLVGCWVAAFWLFFVRVGSK